MVGVFLQVGQPVDQIAIAGLISRRGKGQGHGVGGSHIVQNDCLGSEWC